MRQSCCSYLPEFPHSIIILKASYPVCCYWEMAEHLRRAHREVLSHWESDNGGLLILILSFFFASQKWDKWVSSNVTCCQRCTELPGAQSTENNQAVINPSSFLSVCESLMHVWQVLFLCTISPAHFLAWDSVLLSWPSWPSIHSVEEIKLEAVFLVI